MKVAANLVEKILIAAEAEVGKAHDHGDRLTHSSDYERLVEAFKTAAALRDRPHRIVALRGRKSRLVQEVIVTNLEMGAAGHLYAMCLVPFNQAQVDGQRKTYKYTTDIKAEDDHNKIIGQVRHDSGMLPVFHQQWIRVDRLKEDGFRVR